jgi:polyisoprenoid-binding protein YceI
MQWLVDTSHAVVEFSAKHMGIMTVRGSFSEIDGKIEVENQKPVGLTAVIGVASVSTRQDQRDQHLRSADFFDVENHPTMEFHSTRIEPKGENAYRVTGDLTIRGKTNPIELEMEVAGPIRDPWGHDKIGISMDGKLNRKQWGLEWNALLEGGGVMVGEEVRMHIEVEAAPASSAA